MNVVVNWTSSKLGVRREGWQRCRSGRNSFNHRVLLISRWINVNLQHQSSSTADTHLNLDFFFTESHRWDLSTQQTRCAPSLLLFIEKDSEKEKKMNISVHWYFFFGGRKNEGRTINFLLASESLARRLTPSTTRAVIEYFYLDESKKK